MQQRLWITPAEALPYTPYGSVDAIHRAIRLGNFPFRVERSGRKYLISARSLGLIPEHGTANSEAQDNQVEVLKAAA